MARLGNGKVSRTITRLVAIEDGLGSLRTEVQGTNARLDVLTIRLDHMLKILEAVAEHLKTALDVRPRVDDLEHRVTVLETRESR